MVGGQTFKKNLTAEEMIVLMKDKFSNWKDHVSKSLIISCVAIRYL